MTASKGWHLTVNEFSKIVIFMQHMYTAWHMVWWQVCSVQMLQGWDWFLNVRDLHWQNVFVQLVSTKETFRFSLSVWTKSGNCCNVWNVHTWLSTSFLDKSGLWELSHSEVDNLLIRCRRLQINKISLIKRPFRSIMHGFADWDHLEECVLINQAFNKCVGQLL